MLVILNIHGSANPTLLVGLGFPLTGGIVSVLRRYTLHALTDKIALPHTQLNWFGHFD